MMHKEAEDFVDGVLRELWADWNPTVTQTETFVRFLKNFDYDVAKQAAEDCFAENTAYKTPKLNMLIGFCKKIQKKANVTDGDNSLILVYTLQDVKDKNWKMEFFDNKKNIPCDLGLVMKIADKVKAKCEYYYGRKLNVVLGSFSEEW